MLKYFFIVVIVLSFHIAEHIRTMIVDMATTNQMAMVTNTQAKNIQINIHKVCHWAKTNSNMIQLVNFKRFVFDSICNKFNDSFLCLLSNRTIHKTFRLHFRVFWVDGVKICREDKDVIH